MRMLLAATLLALTANAHAQVVNLDDLWMACDLAQIDAGGDAPMPDAIKLVKLKERAGEPPLLQVLASTSDGTALFCEIAVEVVTFRHNSETLIGE